MIAFLWFTGKIDHQTTQAVKRGGGGGGGGGGGNSRNHHCKKLYGPVIQWASS